MRPWGAVAASGRGSDPGGARVSTNAPTWGRGRGAEGRAEERDLPGTLELFIEPNDRALVDNADNLTVAPWGDLMVCEDGGDTQYIVGVTPEGRLYKFARNALNSSELAGVTFAPDGQTLFVNIQHAGLTLAITGRWRG